MALTKSKGSDARDAATAGRTVFTPEFGSGFSGSSGWGEAIEAIEAEGWTLVQWSVAIDRNGRTVAHPVFRRAGLL